MRCLLRNKKSFEYFPYTGVETDLNTDGEHTGEFHRQYGRPIRMKGNISSPSGNTNTTFYGDDIRYTHTLVMEHPKADVNEYGLIRWNGEWYTITATRPSMNSVTVALKKQTADYYEAPDYPEYDEEETGDEEQSGDQGGEEP